MKYRILLIADAAPGGPAKPESPAETIARLQSELGVARLKIATYEAADADRAATEKQIAAKMAFGLTREQAQAVIKRQKDHDDAEKAKAKDQPKAK